MEYSVDDHSEEVRREFGEAMARALEAVGLQMEGYAKENLTSAGRIDTGNLRNSITHAVVPDEASVITGTNVEYAVFHEVGTGIYLDPELGQGRQDPWFYQDDKGEWHITRGVKPVHYLRNALKDHLGEYRDIIEEYLKK